MNKFAISVDRAKLYNSPALSAKDAHLRHVNDASPGITREPANNGFIYRDPAGRIIRDREELARIKALAVPPAWTDVWICGDRNGHIQATGRDARGRKQYRYHRRWRSAREDTKYEHMLEFGRALPAIRGQVDIDLARPGLPRDKVLAAVVRLMERTLARVGNHEYARLNNSFGLSTLENRHVRIAGGRVELDFRAKSGTHHHSVVVDRELSSILKKCRELPGSELFQYIDEDGIRDAIDSGDLNEYLHEISGRKITAKDFRTWAGTVLAFMMLHEVGEEAPTKKGVVQAIRQVAQHLGNTPAVCRNCYVHPAILESYLDGSLKPHLQKFHREALTTSKVEKEVLRFLALRSRGSASKRNPKPNLRKTLRASLRAARSVRRRQPR